MQVEILPENYTTGVQRIPPVDNFPSKIDQLIKCIIEKEDFIQYKINKRCLSTNGGNYLGELYEIDVKGTTTASDKELNLFIKTKIDNQDSLKILSIANAYENEIFTYKELSKIFEELQQEANVPSEEQFKMVKIYEETQKDTIIMENLSKKGFTTYHRMDVPPLKFIELCVKNLARFHGLSFVIKEKRPEYFNANLKTMKNPANINEDYEEFIKGTSKSVLKKFDKELKEKLEQIYKKIFEKYSNYCKDDNIKMCLCHGDYRSNNIMTKIENDDIVQIIPIDYQLLHYGCPVFDLLYLIYICTDGKFRKAHLSDLKDLYYNTLENFLKYFDVDSQKVYPRNEFERVYEEKLDFGLMMGLQLLPYMFASEDDIPDLTTEMYTSFEIVDSFNERLCEIIEEFTEWGYI